MADNYTYNTNSGVVVPDTANIKAEVEQEFKTALQKEDLDTSESTPQGRLIEAETVARKRTIENMAQLANMFNPDQAYGIFLDSLGALFGIERIGATATRVTCTLSGTANTIIPEGSQVKDTSGNIYSLENSATIGSGGSVTADFLCTEKDAIECGAGTVTQIVTAISGWNSVNNSSAGQTGLAGESDTEFRQQFGVRQYQGTALLQSIKSAILEVEGVESCVVVDNPNSTTKTIVNERDNTRNITMSAHSLYVCVDGGKKEDVAQAIYNTKSMGCAYASSNNETTVGTGTEAEDVYFDNLTAGGGGYTIPIYVEIYVKTGSTSDLTNTIKSAIQAYANNEIPSVDGLKLGVNVNAFEIACAINDQIPELFVQSIKIGTTDATINQDNIAIGVNEKAIIPNDDDHIIIHQLTR
jgi:hypothetical protein